MKALAYLAALLPLNYLMAVAPWSSAWLSIIVLLTYFMFRPERVLHPNNMLFAFFGLYVVLSSTLNLVLSLIDWEYVLPWGQQVYWDSFSPYLFFQAESTFLVLFFGFHAFSRDPPQVAAPPVTVVVHGPLLQLLYAINVVLVLWFLQSTAGIGAWLDDYSFTYLTKREGHGLLNVVNLTVGNALVFLLGVNLYYARRKLVAVALAMPAIFLQAYVNGFKGRLLFLIMLFFAPWLLSMKLKARTLLLFTVGFFVLLYLATLVRSEGFYASWTFFLEMLIGYFNAYQLHDYILTSRDPALFETVHQIFTKPAQMLGLAGADADFDLSVMLTKEFFPDQWDLEHATQQWPLDTELYLNYYGLWFGWIPLLLYSWVVSRLYRASVLRLQLCLVPVFIMEFQRIFSALRGTLIPWEVFFLVVQYLVIYATCRWCLRLPTSPPGTSDG